MANETPDIFDKVRLPAGLDEHLRDTNPWWQGLPGRPLPRLRRWPFELLLRRIDKGIAPIVVLRGPRQVGKTTLLEQLIGHLLQERSVDPRRILRVQFDELPSLRGVSEPILAILRWYQNRVLGRSLNQAAHAGEPAYVLLDEVQNLQDWAPQLKALVDHHSLSVVVTGSSALRIEAGKDSLAGRISEIELGTLLLREISALRFATRLDGLLPQNGLEPLLRQEFWRELRAHGRANRAARDQAFRAFSSVGAYPLAHAKPDLSWPEVADQLNETVIRKVIRHDLRMGDKGRKRDEHLLEEVFRLACRYAGQSPGPATLLNELKEGLHANLGWQRVLSYLRFLDGALLLRLVRPLELRLKKQKGRPKLCLVDHGLRASWLQEVVPIDPQELALAPHLAELAGHLAESVSGAFLAGLPHLDLAHFPERGAEPEVDFVITIGEHRIPIEVKYRRRIDALDDTRGLRAFLEKSVYNAPFGVLVTLTDEVELADPRIVCLPLSSLLLLR